METKRSPTDWVTPELLARATMPTEGGWTPQELIGQHVDPLRDLYPISAVGAGRGIARKRGVGDGVMMNRAETHMLLALAYLSFMLDPPLTV